MEPTFCRDKVRNGCGSRMEWNQAWATAQKKEVMGPTQARLGLCLEGRPPLKMLMVKEDKVKVPEAEKEQV